MLPIPPFFASIVVGTIFPIVLSAWLTRSWMRHQVEAIGPAAGSGTDSAEASDGMKREEDDGSATVFAAVRGPAAWLLLTSLVAMAIQVVTRLLLVVYALVNSLLPVFLRASSFEEARPLLLATVAPVVFSILALLLAAKAVRELDLGRLQARFRCRTKLTVAALVGLWLTSGSVMLIQLAADAFRAGNMLFGEGSRSDLRIEVASNFATPRSIHGPIQMFLLPLLALYLSLRFARRLEPEIFRRTEASTSALAQLSIRLALAGYIAAGVNLVLLPLGLYWGWWFFEGINYPGLADLPIVHHLAGLLVGGALALYVLGPARQLCARLGVKGVSSGMEWLGLFLALSAVMSWPADGAFGLRWIYNTFKMSEGVQSGGGYPYVWWAVYAALVWMLWILFIYKLDPDPDGH